MRYNYDVGIVGLGIMGLSTALQCRARGLSVAGFDKHALGHDHGSTHGASRIIRKAYFEHPDYVPLLERAYVGWRDFERLTHTRIYHDTGLVIFGRKGKSIILDGIRLASRRHGVRISELDQKAARAQFPQFKAPLDAGWEAIFEPDAGYLTVEPALAAMAATARAQDAVIHDEAAVQGYSRTPSGHELAINGETFRFKRLVVAAGGWTNDFLAHLDWRLPLSVHRTVLGWFRCQPEHDEDAGMPAFGFDTDHGFIYGFPAIDANGVKVAHHAPGAEAPNPETIVRQTTDDDTACVVETLGTWLPELDSTPHKRATCVYTMTPDEHFVVDFHPHDNSIVVLAGFSGHGYKFAPAIGDVAASMLMTATHDPSAAFLRANRFSSAMA